MQLFGCASGFSKVFLICFIRELPDRMLANLRGVAPARQSSPLSYPHGFLATAETRAQLPGSPPINFRQVRPGFRSKMTFDNFREVRPGFRSEMHAPDTDESQSEDSLNFPEVEPFHYGADLNIDRVLPTTNSQQLKQNTLFKARTYLESPPFSPWTPPPHPNTSKHQHLSTIKTYTPPTNKTSFHRPEGCRDQDTC